MKFDERIGFQKNLSLMEESPKPSKQKKNHSRVESMIEIKKAYNPNTLVPIVHKQCSTSFVNQKFKTNSSTNMSKSFGPFSNRLNLNTAEHKNMDHFKKLSNLKNIIIKQ